MSSTPKPVRIGNAQAFWGDRTDAAAEMLAREPGLDYLTICVQELLFEPRRFPAKVQERHAALLDRGVGLHDRAAQIQ